MAAQLKYTPVLRFRQEEHKVFTSFDFADNIYPLIEIIKEVDRKPVTMRKGKPVVPKTIKTFEDVYCAELGKINSKKIFVDLPVHMGTTKAMDKDVFAFLRRVVYNRTTRTEYMIKLKHLSKKIIPVISTYFQITGEANTITLQEKDLRPHFPMLAFRTFPDKLTNDLAQISKCVKESDYLIVDLDGYTADPADEELEDLIDRLESWNKCHVIILRPAMGPDITNAGLTHGQRVAGSDNSLLDNYPALNGDSFGDYAGIKKDVVSDGGRVSPGFIFYDATENDYYGYKGKPRLTVPQKLDEYGKTIVPAVISSPVAARMQANGYSYLNGNNDGWQTILEIRRYPDTGRSPAKFKRISILHYLHCMKEKISNGDFD